MGRPDLKQPELAGAAMNGGHWWDQLSPSQAFLLFTSYGGFLIILTVAMILMFPWSIPFYILGVLGVASLIARTMAAIQRTQ